MTKEVIKQKIEQIEASIKEIEPYLSQEEFAEYCDSAYTMIAVYNMVTNNKNKLNTDHNDS